MREALKPVWFIIKTIILLAIAAYPITLIIQWLSDGITPFTTYNRYIGFVFNNYWDWLLVGAATLILTQPGDKIVKLIEDIRIRHYELELIRWKETPYIAPLHLLYLLAPPRALTSDARSNALHPFYKTIVNDFRDRIYINAKYTQFDPETKPSMWKVIGKSSTAQLITNTILVVFCVACMLYINPLDKMTHGWGKAFIPVVAYFLFQNVIIMRAIFIESPNKTYSRITKQFDDEDPKITWRELFPDRPYGESILFAWRGDCERRQRMSYEASDSPVPVRMEYTSPGLAPKPFPSEEIPQWADSAEQYYFDHHKQRNQLLLERNKNFVGTPNNKVIIFQKRK